MDWPTISDVPAIQTHYERCREEGTSHMLAEMFAFQSPPAADSDREFMFGHVNGNQFEKETQNGDAYARIAKKHGVSTTGKVYMRGLARFPGDPQAWISGKGDVIRIAEKEGFNVTDSEGKTLVKSEVKTEPPPPPRLADDITTRIAKQWRKASRKLAARPMEEVKEAVIDKHGRPK